MCTAPCLRDGSMRASTRTVRSKPLAPPSDTCIVFVAVVESPAARFADRPRVAVGFSLGGNVLLRMLGEQGDTLPLDAAVASDVGWASESPTYR